jgi:hypothetical protein
MKSRSPRSGSPARLTVASTSPCLVSQPRGAEIKKTSGSKSKGASSVQSTPKVQSVPKCTKGRSQPASTPSEERTPPSRITSRTTLARKALKPHRKAESASKSRKPATKASSVSTVLPLTEGSTASFDSGSVRTIAIDTSRSANWGKKTMLSLKQVAQPNTRTRRDRVLSDLVNNPKQPPGSHSLTEPNMGRVIPARAIVDWKSPHPNTRNSLSPWKPSHTHPWGQAMQEDSYYQSRVYHGMNTPPTPDQRTGRTVKFATPINQTVGNKVTSVAPSLSSFMGRFQSNDVLWHACSDASPSTRLIREPILQCSPPDLGGEKENYFLPIESQSPTATKSWAERPSCIPKVQGFRLGEGLPIGRASLETQSIDRTSTSTDPLCTPTHYAQPIPVRFVVDGVNMVQISPMESFPGTPRIPYTSTSTNDSSMLSPSPVENLALRLRRQYVPSYVAFSHPGACCDIESSSTRSTRPYSGFHPTTVAAPNDSGSNTPFPTSASLHPFASLNKERSHILDFNECITEFDHAKV